MEDIVDRIYEASVVPDLWVDVLDRLARTAECDGGILIAADRQQAVKAVSSNSLSPMVNAFVEEGWMRKNIRASRLQPQNYAGFIVDTDIVTPEEAETDPFYVNCLRKYGGGTGTGTVIPAPTGDVIIFNFERSYKKGYLDRSVLPALDALRPHLARSALLSIRLGLERARTMTETLSKLDLPGAVLNASGRVLSANKLLEDLNEQFIPSAGGGLAISYRPANAIFEAALQCSMHKVSAAQPLSIPVPSNGSSAACVVHLLPVCGQASDVFTGATHLFIVTSVSRPQAPRADILHGLFDLSPAEARVAQRIAEGRSVDEIARDGNLSRQTIRNQLKSIFVKTGTSRQAELVALLIGAQLRSHLATTPTKSRKNLVERKKR